MTNFIDRVASIALTAAAVIIAGTFAHREFSSQTPRAIPDGPPKYVSDWRSLLTAGEVIGDSAAPFKIIEFGDFECPFCRAADTVFRALGREHGSRVTLIFVHFPLTMHRFAMPAALAAECAATQQRFAAFHDLLYAKQDSLGLKSWTSFAADAGVPDTLRFQNCLRESKSNPVVAAGIAAGRRLGVEGTPTVLLNGWRFPRPPSLAELDSAIRSIAAPRHGS